MKTLTIIAAVIAAALLIILPISAQVTDEELMSIQTPDIVESSIGTLEFFDGVPTTETANIVYDNLDRMRGVDAFLKGIPGASVQALMKGPQAIGAGKINQVVIMDKLMDSTPLYLTGNTSTLYAMPNIDTKTHGPIVIEVPPGLLGAFNDAWFRYIEDVGPAGPDKSEGGSYLVLPPGYEEDIPEGYYIVQSKTYKVWLFMRGSIANGLDAAVKNIKDNLKAYPLSEKDNPPEMEFISSSEKSYNTIHANDYTFFEHINEHIQYESIEMLDPETRGLFASIGIEKNKPFEPDARMKRILTDAVAIANATARSIVWYPRMEGAMIYPDTQSAWMMAWVNKNVFFIDNGAMNSDARVMFHYPYTAVTPAMAVTIPGKGSDYAIAYLDAKKQIFNGAKTYQLHIPANVPAKDFWAITIYDTQTRSQLQTDQKFPSVGSQSQWLKQNYDGSYDIYFGPKAPKGQEGNWLQTIRGKSFFVALRIYGPLEPWINKTWRPGEIEIVE